MDATAKYTSNPDIPTAERVLAGSLAVADTISYGWSYTSVLATPIAQGLGYITGNIIGNTNATTSIGSKFADYEKAQVAANEAAAAKGEKRKVNVVTAIQMGSLGGIETFDSLLFNLPSRAVNSVSGGGWDKTMDLAVSNAMQGDELEIAAGKASISAGREASDIVTSVAIVATQFNKGLNKVVEVSAPTTTLEKFIVENRPSGIAGKVYDTIVPSADFSAKSVQEILELQAKQATLDAAKKEVVNGGINDILSIPQWLFSHPEYVLTNFTFTPN